MKRTPWRCPHCGNVDRRSIETNGEGPKSVHLTLLCLKRVKPSESSFDEDMLVPEDFDARGFVPCAMQWGPNDCEEC